jgi:HPt (histidine-containing phosphotransfer) domain-containing protein
MNSALREESLDLAVIEALRESASYVGPDSFAESLKVYVAESARRLAELRSALAVFDAMGVETVARALRGSSACHGARRLARISQKIEETARAGRHEALEDYFEAAEDEFEFVGVALRQLAETEPDSIGL